MRKLGIVSGILSMLLAVGCATAPAPSSSLAQDEIKVGATKLPAKAYQLNTFQKVHIFVNDIWPELELQDLPLEKKYEFIQAFFDHLTQEDHLNREAFTHVYVGKYFKNGDPLDIVVTDFKDKQGRQRIEFEANAIYNVLMKGILKGSGEFVQPGGGIYNVGRSFLVLGDKIVSDEYLSNNDNLKANSDSKNNIANYYLLNDDETVKSKIESTLTEAIAEAPDAMNKNAVGLTLVEYYAYAKQWDKAEKLLKDLRAYTPLANDNFKTYFKITNDEYKLVKAFETGDKTVLTQS